MPAAVSPFIHGAALGILSFFSVRVTNALSSGPTLYLGAVFVRVWRSEFGGRAFPAQLFNDSLKFYFKKLFNLSSDIY